MTHTILHLFATGQISSSEIGLTHPITNASSAVTGILNTAYTWAGILCVIIIIVAGFFYVISAGESAGVTKAKNTIFGAVIGLIIIILAFVITDFVIGVLK